MAEEGIYRVRIDWEEDQQKGAFANHLLISFDGAVYTLRFYQVLPPVAFGPEALQAVEAVPGRHVTTLVVAKDSMPGIVEVLQGMVNRQLFDDEEKGGPFIYE